MAYIYPTQNNTSDICSPPERDRERQRQRDREKETERQRQREAGRQVNRDRGRNRMHIAKCVKINLLYCEIYRYGGRV